MIFRATPKVFNQNSENSLFHYYYKIDISAPETMRKILKDVDISPYFYKCDDDTKNGFKINKKLEDLEKLKEAKILDSLSEKDYHQIKKELENDKHIFFELLLKKRCLNLEEQKIETMTLEDAKIDFFAKKVDCLIFRNSQSNELNLIYKLEQDKYQLITANQKKQMNINVVKPQNISVN